MKLSRFILAAVLACSVGLHWQLLQSVAWVSMLARYSQAGSFEEALVKTFDGKHPCALCKLAAAAKKSEQPRDNSGLLIKKPELFLEGKIVFVFVETRSSVFSLCDERGELRFARPPSPPPRAA